MKKLLALILTLVFALTLTACSGASEVDAFLDDFEAWADEYIALIEDYKENPSDTDLLNDLTAIAEEGTDLMARMEELEDTIVTEEQSEEFAAHAQAVQEKVEKATEGLY